MATQEARRVLKQMDSTLPLANVRTMAEVI
jgi:hypothetical protein